MDWAAIDWELLGGIAALLAILESVRRWGRRLWQRVNKKVLRRSADIPGETIRIVNHSVKPVWHMGSTKGSPAMQIVSRWYVTNIIDRPVYVLAGRLEKPKTDGMISTKHMDSEFFGTYPIPAGCTTKLSAQFWVKKPVRNEGEDFTSSIVLIDQFGNEHKVRNVVFRHQ